MIIYVNTANYKDYANTPDVIWDTIPVRVPDNFSGGATYDPVNMVWVKDLEPVPPTKEEALRERRLAELTGRYNSLKQEMVFEGLMGRDTSELKEAILLIETELKEFEDE